MLQLVRQATVLADQPALFQGAFDAVTELVLVPGLRDVAIDRLEVDRLDQVAIVGEAGEDDGHQVRPQRQAAPDHLEAMHFRHALVGHHDRDLVLSEHGQRRGTVGRGEHREIVLEVVHEGVDEILLVVDEEDDGCLRCGGGHALRGTGHANVRQRAPEVSSWWDGSLARPVLFCAGGAADAATDAGVPAFGYGSTLGMVHEVATLTSDETAATRALLEHLPTAIAFAISGGAVVAPAGRVPRATVVFRSAASLRALLGAPSLLAFGEAFVAGELDIEGDVVAVLEAAYVADAFAGARAPTPGERPDDAEAVRHHYDLPPEFFALFLDPRMVYTCAYYRTPSDTLDEAQAAKLDLVCRKLDLQPGDRFVDLGCGWGGLVAWAAGRYGADALGVTLSAPQARWGARALREAGLAERARIEHRSYVDVSGDACFDKIASVGLIEHVGVANYAAYFAQTYRLLRPGGLLLNHGITHASPGEHSTGMTFLVKHVFPGAEFQRVGYVIARMEDAGFRIADVEALGAHYALTTAAWLARLQANATAARRIVGERVCRTWIAYLAAATVAFRAGWIDVHQILAYRPGTLPTTPRTRERW